MFFENCSSVMLFSSGFFLINLGNKKKYVSFKAMTLALQYLNIVLKIKFYAFSATLLLLFYVALVSQNRYGRKEVLK